jgi:hypothetical protein
MSKSDVVKAYSAAVKRDHSIWNTEVDNNYRKRDALHEDAQKVYSDKTEPARAQLNAKASSLKATLDAIKSKAKAKHDAAIDAATAESKAATEQARADLEAATKTERDAYNAAVATSSNDEEITPTLEALDAATQKDSVYNKYLAANEAARSRWVDAQVAANADYEAATKEPTERFNAEIKPIREAFETIELKAALERGEAQQKADHDAAVSARELSAALDASRDKRVSIWHNYTSGQLSAAEAVNQLNALKR